MTDSSTQNPEMLHVLLVELDSSDTALIDGLLDEELGRDYQLSRVPRLEKARQALKRSDDVDCILLDLPAPNPATLGAVTRLRRAAPDTPIIVLTSDDEEQQGVEALRRGAQDYLIKGRISGEMLSRAIEFGIERHRIRDNLRRAALTDELTGLRNRRSFVSQVEHLVEVATRRRQSFTLLFVDIDAMKTINDSQGHHEGDRALVDTARLLEETCRSSDLAARIGGDEFCVLLTDASDGAAKTFINRLQGAVDEHNRTAARPFHLSLSVGMAAFDPDNPGSIEDLMKGADEAMYEVKDDPAN
jgi:two-component system, cell cycle response regulator